MMFFTFAMTTDAVGSVVLSSARRSRAVAQGRPSTFHYVPMAAIAVGALGLGYLADRIGRRGSGPFWVGDLRRELAAVRVRRPIRSVRRAARRGRCRRQRLQDRGARVDRRFLALDARAHDVHEHGGGILRRRRDRRARHRGDAAHRRALVEIPVRGGRRDLRAAHHHGGGSALSTHARAGRPRRPRSPAH